MAIKNADIELTLILKSWLKMWLKEVPYTKSIVILDVKWDLWNY